jgi:menaquinone-dependent protoporphyrinogen oxidase
MASILVVYGTTDGQTRRICERLRAIVEGDGHQVTLVPIEAAGDTDPSSFDKVVVGASIRYGKHSPLILAFANRHASVLDTRPNAFFTVNIVARKPEKNRPETNPYLQKFLRRISWRPKELEVFAGKLDYPRYRFFDRLMIRFIMLITDGPTDPSTVIEYTDWGQVEAFAHRIARM